MHGQTVYIDVLVGSRRRSFFCYAKNDGPVHDAAEYLDGVVAGLEGGCPYEPPGLAFEFLYPAAWGAEPPLAEQLKPWPFRQQLDLGVLQAAVVGPDRIVLPASWSRRLKAVGPAYWWLPVAQDQLQFLIRWRPLYPHE